MKKTIVILLLTLFVSVCQPPASSALNLALYEDWEITDTALLGASNALIILDWSQTRQSLNNARRFKEHNYILGDEPTVQQLDMFIPLSFLLHNILAATLPKDYRRNFMFFVAGAEFAAVQHNSHVVGIGLWF